MIKLKSLLKESEDNSSKITPHSIYNFYYLFSVASYHPEVMQSDYGKFIQREYLKALKNKYIHLFKRLVVEQLIKYFQQKRTDPDFDVSKVKETSSAFTLTDLMSKTFRSDMKRRNDVWIQTSKFLTELENTSAIKDTYIYIDRLNSMVHNTGGNILGKVSSNLVQTYNTVHNAKSIKDYERFVDKDLRQLMDQKPYL